MAASASSPTGPRPDAEDAPARRQLQVSGLDCPPVPPVAFEPPVVDWVPPVVLAELPPVPDVPPVVVAQPFTATLGGTGVE